MKRDLILASASPRRSALLSEAGFRFVVDPAAIDESCADDEPATLAAGRLAIEKATAVIPRHPGSAVVLGADTVVVIDGVMLGKPVDRDDAARMLGLLAGRTHTVVTAWAVLQAGAAVPALGVSGFTRSAVRMRELGAAEIASYAGCGEPLDKAGAYALQGRGRSLVAAVVGSFDNVIGLPVAQVAAAMEMLGVVPVPDSTELGGKDGPDAVAGRGGAL